MEATLVEREAQGIETPEEVEACLLDCAEQATELLTKMVRLVRKIGASRSPAPDHSEIEIDTRELIRESRVYESTAGPPPDPKNEAAPPGGVTPSKAAIHSKGTAPAEDVFARKLSATVSPHNPKNQPQFFALNKRAQKPGVDRAVRDLNHEDVADDISKTRH
jgi:hypothetical protein